MVYIVDNENYNYNSLFVLLLIMDYVETLISAFHRNVKTYD